MLNELNAGQESPLYNYISCYANLNGASEVNKAQHTLLNVVNFGRRDDLARNTLPRSPAIFMIDSASAFSFLTVRCLMQNWLIMSTISLPVLSMVTASTFSPSVSRLRLPSETCWVDPVEENEMTPSVMSCQTKFAALCRMMH